jgi:hypothetical protein
MYVKAIDGVAVKYPYTQTDLVWDNPSTSFPMGGVPTSTLNEWDMFPVQPVAAPQFDAATHKLVERTPLFDGQSWTQQWVVEALVQAEIDARNAQQAASVRAERNRRLAACDWTQLADAPVDDLAWAVYRQKLRDLPNQAGFPLTIIWPVQPEA